MDSVSLDVVKQLVNEALKQSPSGGNGWGFGLATVLCLGIVCLAGLVIISRRYERYRDKQDARRASDWKDAEAAREAARQRLFDYFTTEFGQLRADVEKWQESFDDRFEAARGKIEDVDKELIRLKLELEHLKKT